MSKYVTRDEQAWEPADVLGIQMDRCLLWDGGQDVFAGLFRMPRGMTIPIHRHDQWVQILILSGKMRVEEQGKSCLIGPGEYYFVEPGDAHVESALEDTLLLVVADVGRSTAQQSGSPF